MARARNLKPGFFRNEFLADLPPLTRLFFQGLWCEADRRGILEDRPKRLKGAILPYDNADPEKMLADLQDGGFIKRYECDGVRCIHILTFEVHQNPHYKEEPSELPAPPDYSPKVVAFGVPEAKRQEIFTRDGRKCVNCGSTERLSLDHIVPRSKGGSGSDDNLQTLCGRCNTAKNNRLASATSDQTRTDVEPTSGYESPASPARTNHSHPDPLIPDSGEPKGSSRVPAREKKPNLAGFGEWYQLYPRHEDRAEAEKSWAKLKPDERQAALDAIRDQIHWPQMQGETKFIPLPTTWLNRKRWESEPPQIPPNGYQNGRSPTDIVAEAERIRERRNGRPEEAEENMIDVPFVERR